MFHDSLEVAESRLGQSDTLAGSFRTLRSKLVQAASKRRNRNRLQIAQAILHVTRNGAGKTRILYGANLSFKLLQDYLAVLVKAGLIEVRGGERKVYSTTSKGMRFLEEFDALERFVALASAKRNELSIMLARAASTR